MGFIFAEDPIDTQSRYANLWDAWSQLEWKEEDDLLKGTRTTSCPHFTTEYCSVNQTVSFVCIFLRNLRTTQQALVDEGAPAVGLGRTGTLGA